MVLPVRDKITRIDPLVEIVTFRVDLCFSFFNRSGCCLDRCRISIGLEWD